MSAWKCMEILVVVGHSSPAIYIVKYQCSAFLLSLISPAFFCNKLHYELLVLLSYGDVDGPILLRTVLLLADLLSSYIFPPRTEHIFGTPAKFSVDSL